jgi:hypothetical protein
MIFAEIVSSTGRRLHIGCVMAAGPDWIEVSVPIRLKLEDNLGVCFLPSKTTYTVNRGWRRIDRVGLTYIDGELPNNYFIGSELYEPLPASLRKSGLSS